VWRRTAANTSEVFARHGKSTSVRAVLVETHMEVISDSKQGSTADVLSGDYGRHDFAAESPALADIVDDAAHADADYPMQNIGALEVGKDASRNVCSNTVACDQPRLTLLSVHVQLAKATNPDIPDSVPQALAVWPHRRE
jgi:hypothetical protein